MYRLIQSIPFRIYAIAVLAVICSCALAVLLLSRAVDQTYQMQEKELANILETSSGVLTVLNERVDAGEMTLDEAKAEATALLSALRFGDSGYMSVFDNDMVMRVHPFKPDWIGEDKSDFEDSKGLRLFDEMLNIALTSGAGVIRYWFTKPGEDAPEEKMGAVRYFAPWGWVVVTGAYLSDIKADLAAMRDAGIATLLATLCLLTGTSILLVRSVTRPLSKLMDAMRKVSEGDYDHEIKVAGRKDEIGFLGRILDSFRQKLIERRELEIEQQNERERQNQVVQRLSRSMSELASCNLTEMIDDAFPEAYEQLRRDFNAIIETLNDVVRSIVDNADEINARANVLGSASDELSQRTENQAATLEETAAAMDEITSSVRTAATSASDVARTVEAAREDAVASRQIVSSAVEAMSEIKVSSDSVAEIIGVIDDIAFQTNLLALNAGVEAARAGEAGRGFAVVASEVRSLSQRSSEAAKEIARLISRSSAQVETGVDQVQKSGEALAKISERVTRIADAIQKIAASAQEQSVGINEINVAVGQLDQVTQKNAAMVEEAGASTVALKREAKEMRELIARFALRPSAPADVKPEAPVAPEKVAAAHTPAPPQFRRVANGDAWQDF
ncbi:hypothetical protein AL036_17305 [Salipiger aestuarii]|uniref:Methyl-accepting chemotaxis sensory transducer with Cache sensor n=2 Tax=Salipiger aestuarii TaxID=568098 RepID=A0A327XS98_9RHOB|nr:methyl-accepting chemotaxis protein [Salipiger aestuarii]KAA8605797.1 hypothetical protein AL036_17305 [Salipiger aestuarii]KAA8608292.1 hypothetical protein AL037_17200 [Salipiger aestuarii]KAB2540578.1 hypothetical protein AL035_16925 [Salipiger aestuarii]RAK11021.1 methyl-accepting chemotaxis sensory transducer with Cache sensor [Salipiger aestuarii]